MDWTWDDGPGCQFSRQVVCLSKQAGETVMRGSELRSAVVAGGLRDRLVDVI